MAGDVSGPSEAALPVEPSGRHKIRVLIIDDHAVVRQGLRTLIELQNDMELVGEGGSGETAVVLSQQLQPDVLLLDLVMPGLDGVAATGHVLAVAPHTRILILTSFGEDDKLFPAIRAGAHGYLLKDIEPQALMQAIRQAHAGEPSLHPQVASRLMSAVAGAPEVHSGGSEQALFSLTEREQEVLQLIARGLTNQDIAATMVISEATVKTHVGHLLAKLGVADRTQAAIWALKHGFGEDN